MRWAGTRTILFVVFSVLTALGCKPPESELPRTTPVEIRGVWTCEDPAYAGRSLEILEKALLFHSGGPEYSIYTVLSVRSGPGDGATVYEIEHRGEEVGSMTLSLLFRSADSTIVLQNQPEIVWKRTG